MTADQLIEAANAQTRIALVALRDAGRMYYEAKNAAAQERYGVPAYIKADTGSKARHLIAYSTKTGEALYKKEGGGSKWDKTTYVVRQADGTHGEHTTIRPKPSEGRWTNVESLKTGLQYPSAYGVVNAPVSL